MEIPPSVGAFIRERVLNFEKEVRPQDESEIPHVVEHGGLPLYRGWTETLAIRPDGTLVKWSTDEWPGAKEFNDPVWIKVAVTQGAKLYPELLPIVPQRPSSAMTCEACDGTGDPLHQNERLRGTVVCSCGGVGWLEAPKGT
jgi:hypothetical protein